jgi:gluconate 2-dehydrogenase gamma chain
MPDRPPLSRAAFVAIGAAATAAIVAEPSVVEAATTPAPPAPPKVPKAPAQGMAMPALGERPEAYAYFTPPEVAFVEAAVERLIPTDRHGPGGKDAGVAYYIDQQLFGRYGRGDTMYTHGPWAPALPTQGYQLRLTPAEVYRLGIAATDAHAMKTYGKLFHALDGAHQDDVLSAVEAGTVTSPDVPMKTFFGMLLGDTVQGFFADPMYGGNRDKIGWKTIGFPGVGAVYYGAIDKRNVPYVVDPVGIADEMKSQMAILEGSPVEHVQTRVAGRAQSSKGTA